MAERRASAGRSGAVGGDDEANPLVGSEEIRQAVRLELQQSWSGPLPPPESLEQYEKLLPGAAERILAMAERSATGQIDMADKLAEAEIEGAKMGQSLAFALTLIAFIASIVFFALGQTVAGVAFISVPVVMLIRSFITRS